MATCSYCGKGNQTGRKISITRSQVSRRWKKTWKPNIKKVKINDNGTHKTVHICTRCLRSNKVERIA